MKKAPQSFFNRHTLIVARELIGCFLVRKTPSGIKRFVITETEAYIGPHDKASHAFKGRTPRTEVMYGPGGTIYIYFVYGMHYMLNIVTGMAGYPAAVLIRAVESISGPGRVAQHLGIDKALNNLSLGTKSGLWVELPSSPIARKNIIRTPRIGINYAGPEWAEKKYRFLYKKPSLERKGKLQL